MYNKISILGCGWLGLPLGKELISKGYSVKGSTTSSDKLPVLRELGIEPFFLMLNPEIRCRNIMEFLDSDIIILNIPPPKKRPDLINFHLGQVRSLLAELKKSNIKKGIFISSTSVYGEENKTITEDHQLQPSKRSGDALVVAEKLLRSQTNIEFTVLRLGGLIGNDRNPVKYMAGKHIENGQVPVNLIHRDDCIGIVEKIIEKEAWGEVFNAVADEHPTKEAFYTKAAKVKGIESPTFGKEKGKYKIISNEKVKQMLDYKFKFSDPMDMI